MYILYIYMCMNGGQNYLLLAMDMAKVGGPLSVVKGFHTNLIVPSPLPTTTLVSRNNLSVTHQLSEIMQKCLGPPFLGAVVNQRQPNQAPCMPGTLCMCM